MGYINKLIRKDFDGYHFVDYLRAIESEFDEPEYYLTFLEAHRSQIVSGLDNFRLDTHVLRKYKWLKTYHNVTVKSRFQKDFARKYVV